MNRRNRGILVGMSLGDGYLSTRGGSHSLHIEHSVRQLPYLEHKAARLLSIFGGKPRTVYRRSRLDKRTNVVYNQCSIAKGNKYFGYLRKRIYPHGAKRYTRQVLDYLTPEGIAIWYMDDGNCKLYTSKRTGRISCCQTYLATHCSKEEADILLTYFKEVWDISFKAYARKDSSYILCANTAASRQFVALIRKYVIPSMAYKLRHVPIETHECPAPVPRGEDMVQAHA
jgi:hypothetical protein